MKIREWIADNIGYRFSGCAYAKYHDRIFDPIEKIIPEEFKRREISDLGCGDGANTLRIKKIFKAKSITGYEKNPYLIKRAKERDLKTVQLDFNNKIPKGKMATFSFALHHIRNEDKVRVLRKVASNFDYVFLIEPTRDLYHTIFDAGEVLKREEWIKVFDEALGKYKLHRQDNHIVAFYKSK